MQTDTSGSHTPYYAVIFTSQRAAADDEGYAQAADRMLELAAAQPGFLGVEDARDANGIGITVSYWADLESIRRWRDQPEHLIAQQNGRTDWYQWFRLRVCKVEREATFERAAGLAGESPS